MYNCTRFKTPTSRARRCAQWAPGSCLRLVSSPTWTAQAVVGGSGHPPTAKVSCRHAKESGRRKGWHSICSQHLSICSQVSILLHSNSIKNRFSIIEQHSHSETHHIPSHLPTSFQHACNRMQTTITNALTHIRLVTFGCIAVH